MGGNILTGTTAEQVCMEESAENGLLPQPAEGDETDPVAEN